MIDLFAAKFQFKIDKSGEESKKTILGQVLSLLVIIASLAYLVFLIYQMWEKLIPPAISTEVLLPDGDFKYDFDYSPVSIRIYAHDEEVAKNIDKYFTIWIMVKDNEANTKDIATMKKCNDLKLGGKEGEEKKEYHENDYCLDIEHAHIMSNRQNHLDYRHLYFSVSRCDNRLNKEGELLPTNEDGEVDPDDKVFDCVEHELIDEQIKDPNFQILITNIFHELNHNNGVLEEKDDEKKVYIDHDIIQHSIIEIKVAETDIDEHPLWTQNQKTIYAYDYKETKYFYTDVFVVHKFKEEIFKHALLINQIILSPNLKVNTVVFEKFPDVLAKFLSIFNALLFIGIVGSLTSEAKLLECTMDIFLKDYYKSTALQLHQQKLQQQAQKKQPSAQKIEDKNINQQNQKDPNSMTLFDFPEDQEILDLNPCKSLFLHNTASKKAEQRQRKLSKQEDEEEQTLETESVTIDDVYIKLFKETQGALEFKHLYKEILQLKTQVQLLMTEPQYAASQFTCRHIYSANEKVKRNHLEKMDLIQQDKNYRNQQYQVFINSLKDENSQKQLSQLDIRIAQCCYLDIKKQLVQQQKNQIANGHNNNPGNVIQKPQIKSNSSCNILDKEIEIEPIKEIK